MNIVAKLAMFLLIPTAYAEVKPGGTIMESQCSVAQETTPLVGGYLMNRICEAEIVGSNETYLVVHESSLWGGYNLIRKTVWQVTKTSGNQMAVEEIGFQGDDHVFQPKLARSYVVGEVKVKRSRGTTLYREMTGQLGGRKFSAQKFNSIFHTM